MLRREDVVKERANEVMVETTPEAAEALRSLGGQEAGCNRL